MTNQVKYYFVYYKVETFNGFTIVKEWDSIVVSIHPFKWAHEMRQTSDNKKFTVLDYHQIKTEEYELYCRLKSESELT